jgi:hypothetical protein
MIITFLTSFLLGMLILLRVLKRLSFRQFHLARLKSAETLSPGQIKGNQFF